MDAVKTCAKCNVEKSVWEFSFKNTKRGTRNAYCKPCKNEYNKEHYTVGKDAYIETQRQRRKRCREVLIKLKSNPCVDCGKLYHWCQMDFDHREGVDKCGNVSQLFGGYGIKRGLEEVKKCDLVCSNCHRLRTWKRMNISG